MFTNAAPDRPGTLPSSSCLLERRARYKDPRNDPRYTEFVELLKKKSEFCELLDAAPPGKMYHAIIRFMWNEFPNQYHRDDILRRLLYRRGSQNARVYMMDERERKEFARFPRTFKVYRVVHQHTSTPIWELDFPPDWSLDYVPYRECVILIGEVRKSDVVAVLGSVPNREVVVRSDKVRITDALLMGAHGSEMSAYEIAQGGGEAPPGTLVWRH